MLKWIVSFNGLKENIYFASDSYLSPFSFPHVSFCVDVFHVCTV